MARALKINLKTKQTLTGLLFLVLALLTLLSLLTYHPEDYAVLTNATVHADTLIHNWAGRTGVVFNHFLILLIGFWGAILVPVFLGYLGWQWLSREAEGRTRGEWIGLGLVFLLWPAFLAMWSARESLRYSNRVGGALASLLEALFGTPGSVIVVLGLLLMGVILLTDLSLAEFVELAQRKVREWAGALVVYCKKAWIVFKEKQKIRQAQKLEAAKKKQREAALARVTEEADRARAEAPPKPEPGPPSPAEKASGTAGPAAP